VTAFPGGGPDDAPFGAATAERLHDQKACSNELYLKGVVLSPVREVTVPTTFTTLSLCQTVDQNRS